MKFTEYFLNPIKISVLNLRNIKYIAKFVHLINKNNEPNFKYV
jgi:hypothetical protein